MSLRCLALPALLTLSACPQASDRKDGNDAPPSTSTSDDDDSGSGSGDDDDLVTGTTGDTGAEPPAVLTAPEIVYALPNVDNDYDFSTPSASDDELEPFEIVLSEEPASTLRLHLDGTTFARIWHDGVVVAESTVDGASDGSLPWPGGTITLSAELGIFDVDGTLVVEELDTSGAVLHRAETRLRASPLLLNHHLQDAELVVAVQAAFYGVNNDAFLDGFTTALGTNFEYVPGNQVGFDVWMQDEIEFATGTLPDGRRMDTVIDSIRDRGLDPYPEARWQGEQFGVAHFGSMQANSRDSFGNLEVTPPIDGYPMGRIYYGSSPTQPYFQPNDTVLFDFLEAQQIQAPIPIDTSWLCVGHVDEFMSFIPDDTAPRGFRLLYTDTQAAWDLLDTLDPATPLPRYAGRRNHGIGSVADLVNDTGLRVLNEDLQADYLDPILADLTAELALTPDEIVRVPGLFEEPRGCGRAVAALIPGMVNLVSTTFSGQHTVFMADPFLREDLADPSSDPMIAHVEGLLPAATDVVFLDDWEVYHLALGEVHCGSNTLRTPAGDWWTNDPGGHQ